MAARVRNRSKIINDSGQTVRDIITLLVSSTFEHVILRFKHPSALKGWALFLSRSTYEELELT